MVQALPAAKLDLLVKVDTWELVSFKTERAKAALELGDEDRGFVRCVCAYIRKKESCGLKHY